MSDPHSNPAIQAEKHKVFISYYPHADQGYRNAFERIFGHLFISKSVEPGFVTSDLGADYIERLIREGYITERSVVIVLVGPKTYGRRNVDWEISAGLNKKAGGYSGLIGILLPEFPLQQFGNYLDKDLPARLADNAKSGFASTYLWDWFCADQNRVTYAIQSAFEARIGKANLVDNSREQMDRDLCD